MNSRNWENPEQSFEDVQKAEEILRKHPAPEPNKELIANIKAEITAALLRRQSNTYKRIIYKAVAVAALSLASKGSGFSWISSLSL